MAGRWPFARRQGFVEEMTLELSLKGRLIFKNRSESKYLGFYKGAQKPSR